MISRTIISYSSVELVAFACCFALAMNSGGFRREWLSGFAGFSCRSFAKVWSALRLSGAFLL